MGSGASIATLQPTDILKAFLGHIKAVRAIDASPDGTHMGPTWDPYGLATDF